MPDDQFQIQSDSPAAPKMLFWRMAGHESLSRPSAYELWVLSESADLSPRDVLGRAFDVVIDFYDELGGQHQRHCQGHAVRFIRGGDVGRYHQYRITLRSWFWLLTKRSNSRVLQDQDALQILDAVCGDSPITRFKKTDAANVLDAHPPRRYCVQYNETDYTYLSRLLQDEGIYYWFDAHDAPGTMILSDASGVAHQKLPAAGTLTYNGGDSEARHAEIMRWSDTDFFDTGKHAARDRNFKTVRQTVGAGQDAAGTYELADLEAFEYPGGYFDNARAQDVAKVRGDELAARRQRHWALSHWPDIAAGRTFTLKGSPGGDDGDYLIGASTFFISHPGYESQSQPEDPDQLLPVWNELLQDDPVDPGAAEAIAAWIGDSPLADRLHGASVFAFTALPAAVNYRPPRTIPRRTMPGPQSAFVVGSAGQELDVDSFGRVKVQFHWDRYGKNDDHSSCWVRVSQPWAGKGWGGYFAPRIGQEVLVDFLNGDPDRPVIAGRLYNDDQTIPYSSPTQSGFRTRSTPGGSPANCNEFRFEDKMGSEQVYLHAEKDQCIEVENDETHSVDHNRTKTIGNDETTNVSHDRTESVGNNETISIGVNRTENVGVNETISIGSNRTISVGASETATVALQRTHTVGVNETITVGAAQEITVGAAQAITVGAAQVITVGAEQQVQVGKNQTVNVGAKQESTIGAGQTMTVTGGQTFIITSGGQKFSITGDQHVDATGLVQVIAGPSIEFRCGQSSIKMDSGGHIDIKGTQIDIEAPAINIKGGDGTVTTTAATVSTTGGTVTSSATKVNTVEGTVLLLNP